MKFNLAISLLVHVVIFAFLNIHKNEKSSDELISSVSVISQNYYDALISRKPDINHNLIQKQPDVIKLEEELDFDIANPNEKFINIEKKVLAKLDNVELDLFKQNLKLPENQIPNIQNKNLYEFKSSHSIQVSENHKLDIDKSFFEREKGLGFKVPILQNQDNLPEDEIMKFFSNNKIKYRDVKNSNADILFSANKYLKKSEKILENKIKLSGNSYFNKSTNSPNLDDFSNQLVRLASNKIIKELVFRKYDQTNQNYKQTNTNVKSNTVQQNNSQVAKSLKEWGNLILVVINSKIKYPKIALNKNISGQVLVRLKISTKGNLKTIKILKSSGFSILDNEVLRAIKTTNYFPSAPKPLDSKNYTFKLPVKFEI